MPAPHLPIDSRTHHHVIARIVRAGHAPTVDELARALDCSPADAEASLRRLHDNHGLVLHPERTDVWMAHPFSLSPTDTWVADGDRGWWTPCLWCGSGVVAVAAPTCTIHTRIAGEAEPLALEVRDGAPVRDDLVVHFAVPPRDAWRNVVHHCAALLPFHADADVTAWSERHRIPRGAVVPIAQVFALGRAWYGPYLDEDWRKWSIPEARDIFARVGLTGSFWELPDADRPF